MWRPSWSFSTIFSPSRAWRTHRATLLEPLLKWLVMTLFLMPPIDLGHGANPRATREIQVPCRVSSSCVEPVLIVGSKFFMLGQLDGVTGTCSFPDFLRKAARALTNSCWFMSFTVTPGIVRPPRCQPGAKSLSFKNRYIIYSAVLNLCCSAPAACGTLISQPGMVTVSTALQSRFLTTGPPGKSPVPAFLKLTD